MMLKRVSDLTGVTHFREIKVTQAELDDWKRSGEFIQSYFPELSDSDREFILTGITPEEWDLFVGDPEDEDVLPSWIGEDDIEIVVEKDNE